MKTYICYILPGVLLFSACGNEQVEKAPVNIVDSSKTPVNEYADFKFHTYIANIPSPLQTINDLSKAELTFKKDLLNKPENESHYLTSTKKALNYGVYGVDMAYLATNKEFTEVSKYLATCRNLSISLDAVESFDKIVGSRIQGNLENKDTVIRIMDETFEATDKYLQTNERQVAAVEILTGGWIESQNITLNLLKDIDKNSKNEFLYTQLYEQKFHLKSLTDLLKQYEKQSDLKPITEKIAMLNEDFSKVESVNDITKEKIKDLAEKISVIRELIVK